LTPEYVYGFGLREVVADEALRARLDALEVAAEPQARRRRDGRRPAVAVAERHDREHRRPWPAGIEAPKRYGGAIVGGQDLDVRWIACVQRAQRLLRAPAAQPPVGAALRQGEP